MNAVDLSFQRFGSGERPLLILHGLFGSGRNWYSMGKKLAETYTVFLPDQRNHGASIHSPRMDIEVLVEDVRRFMDLQEMQSATLIGHSMGGKVAMWAALTMAARIRRLVVVDIAPVAYQHGFEDILDALEGLPVTQLQSRKQADELLSERITEPGLRQFLLQNLVSVERGYAWRVDLGIMRASIPSLMKFPEPGPGQYFTGPVLFVGGGNSRYIRPEHHATIHQTFPSAEIAMIDDAGHWPHIDQPETFDRILEGFLKSDSKPDQTSQAKDPSVPGY